MGTAVYLVGRSQPYAKVLAQNSNAPVFPSQQLPRLMEPGTVAEVSDTVPVGTLETDVKSGGKGGEYAPGYILLQPYSENPPGTTFYMNVWGYNQAGSANQPGGLLWIPFFIVQLQCTTANIPGPLATSFLHTSENLCDTLGVTLGSLGTGYYQSHGQDYAAFVKVDLVGAQRFLCEFAADPMRMDVMYDSVPGMNALWRPV